MPPGDPLFWVPANFAAYGDPYGTPADTPFEFAPLSNRGQPLPGVDSNALTVFSILDTAAGTVSNYIFDTKRPAGKAFKFDEFSIPLGSV